MKISAPVKVAENIWQFNEGADFRGDGTVIPYVDAWLVVGEERAVLVDTLQNCENLFELVREITDKPIDVLITHGHGDHVGASTGKFAEDGCKIYMAMVDYEGLTARNPSLKKEWFTDLADGDTFDIGGYSFETVFCPGHTPGCVAFYDKKNRIIFSGDTIGSGGFWMQLPMSLPLDQFLVNLDKFIERVDADDDLIVYPGHRNQSPVQLTGQYYKDARTITAAVIDGTMEGEDGILERPGFTIHYKSIAYGMMRSYCYDPKKIKS